MTTPDDATPGRAPSVDVAIAAALARANDELRQIPDDVASDHLSAITALAAAHAHPAPVVTAAAGGRTRLRRLAGLTAFKLALGAGVAAAATTGGLAATGNLPDPVQRVVSEGAGWFGVDLPVPDPMPGIPSQAPNERGPDGNDSSVVPDPIPSPTAPADHPSRPDQPTPAPSGDGTPSAVPPTSPPSERPDPRSEQPDPPSQQPDPPLQRSDPPSERPDPPSQRPAPEADQPVPDDEADRRDSDGEPTDPGASTSGPDDPPSSPPPSSGGGEHPGDGGPLPAPQP